MEKNTRSENRRDRKREAPERFKNPFGRSTRPIGAPPERETVAGVRRDTGAGVWRFRGGVVVDARSAVESRAGSSAVAPRTVLEHLQQREGRDLDVLRGVHLRGIPGRRLGSAPHHTPATHHAGDVHRALFTCAWHVRVHREVRAKPDLTRLRDRKELGRSVSTVCKLEKSQLSLRPETRQHQWSFPASGTVRALDRERIWHR